MGKKNTLDKFYTVDTVAQHCVNKTRELVGFNYNVILEPSAGSGNIWKLLPQNRLGLDIAPEHPELVEADYLNFKWDTGLSYLVIGNPPFGTNANLAKQFFNYSAKFARVIAFIVPRSFRKVSVQNQLDLNFKIIYDEILPTNSFTLEGKPYAVPCAFQIWVRSSPPRQKITLPLTHKDFSWSIPTQSQFSLRRVGALAGKINRDLSYAQSSNYFINSHIEPELLFERFQTLYSKLNETAQDTAGNPSIGKAEIVNLYTQQYG